MSQVESMLGAKRSTRTRRVISRCPNGGPLLGKQRLPVSTILQSHSTIAGVVFRDALIPKGVVQGSLGQRPRYGIEKATNPEGAKQTLSRPFRACRACLQKPRALPWAILFRPFGATESLRVARPVAMADGPDTRTLPEIDVEEKLKEAFARGWSVIVWNDPVNLMDYVVYVFKTVLKMNEKDASRHMWEVHQKGKSLVARETREKSEMIVHRLRSFGLNATMEQEKA